MEERNATLRELIGEVDRPLWRSAALARLEEIELQVGALQKFYDWYLNAGSWSDVSLKPEDGCRWILKPAEVLEGDRLSDSVDAVLGTSEKRVEPSPNCNHEFVNQPLRGGWFCLNCNGQR